MISGNCGFERRHVLYCDILGFSSYVQSEFFQPDRCFRLFNELDKLIEDSYSPIDESIPDLDTGQVPDYVIKPEATYCSDSIIISTPVSNVDAMWLCQAAAQIQNGICAHGFLLRGAITTGEIYHSGNTIFGPAITKAVSIEASGIPPIIAISQETIKIFQHAESDEDKEIIKIREQQLIAYNEGIHPYLDPFWLLKCQTNQKDIHPDNLIRIDTWRTLINRGLLNKEPSVNNKYSWMANHFNQSLCNKISLIEPITFDEKLF